MEDWGRGSKTTLLFNSKVTKCSEFALYTSLSLPRAPQCLQRVNLLLYYQSSSGEQHLPNRSNNCRIIINYNLNQV